MATYLLGGRLPDGTEITPKYIGQRRLVEVAVATLATDRALLLLGVPGTAKTWVSEHLAAAVSGDSTLLVQGTSGTPEEAIRYGWNYARLLAEGPSRGGAGAQPGHAGHGAGRAGPHRGADPHPVRRAGRPHHHPLREDAADPRARRRGAGPAGLQRDRHRQRPRPGRQRAVVGARSAGSTPSCCPCPADAEEEVGIVARRVAELGAALELPAELDALAEIRRVVTVFRELRSGVTADGRTKLKSPTATLSHRRGHLGGDQRRCRSPPTSATGCCGPPTSPPA